MEKIKDKYLNPVPVLYTYKGMPENTLISNDFDTAKNITLTKNDNEVSQLTFSIPFTVDRKVSYDDCEKLVLFENEYYIIKDIQVEDNATGSIKVTCKHKSVELKGIYCEPINLIGVSPKDMFDKIMTSTKHPYNTGYKFKGTDVPSDKKRHLITENEASVYENLVSMAKVFNGWLEFSTDDSGQNWIFLRTKTIKNNKYVKKGLDMKALNISYNSDELFTRVQPFGAKDKYGIEVNIMGVNPTKQSYVANYSWYLAKGIPMEVIKREAQYQQFKQMHMDEYTDAKDLYEFALEELEKCCVPKLEATLDMQDLSIYVDSLDEPPEIGYEITCINPDIDFILSCQITGVERNYDNPMATKVTIANFIRYDTVFQNINHGATK
ncbi:prophage endopeptidase tail family protein [Clostridium botulinum]|uniref:prophage endopeptidase tail family protein n=1 Tax=Clostridium botulinum TaxID=1491 RepID=UPI001C9B0540|nr:prophage endopeptidase tail family protein [Clostridium botulinum]MBY6838856.1 phage tail protein [Clostridium botulinum]